MRAGDLNKRIELQRRTVAGGLDTWATVATVWAAVEPLSGSQYFQNLVASTDITGKIRIRYRADIKPDWRIKLGTRLLHIVSLINWQEQNRELQIMYKEAI